MRVDWLRRHAGTTELTVVFNGWGIDPGIWATLDYDGDLLVVSDYRSLADDLPDLSSYRRRSLITWSLGVASYALWQSTRADVFHRKVALCGSMTPVDRLRGIAPALYKATGDDLTEASFQAFVTHCFGAPQPMQAIDVAARKDELIAIGRRDYAGVSVKWDRVWISRQDRIFPLAAMRRAWAGSEPILRIIDAPHAPFARWRSLGVLFE